MNVSFAFETGSGHHFNAGSYTIRMENAHTLLIQGAADAAMTMTIAQDNAQPAEKGKAIFRRYGNQYLLSEIVVAGKSRRLYCAPSKKVSQALIAGSASQSDTIELALLDEAR